MKLFKTLLLAGILLVGAYTNAQDKHAEMGLKKVVVKEVLQVSSYTYLRVLEGEVEKWLAVPTTEAKVDQEFYYKGGMAMPNFTSSELKKTFDEVIFLGSITSADAIDIDKGTHEQDLTPKKSAKEATLSQLTDLTIEAIEGGTRIGEVFENKASLSGKTIRIKGEVTKFSGGIMGKNWVHFQDGTSFEGQYDLMITTQAPVAVGDQVIFEGVIATDVDLGAGYFYKVIMEEAVLVK